MTDYSQGADAQGLPALVQAVADELHQLGVPPTAVEAVLAIELANEASGYLCKNRASISKELRSIMEALRERAGAEDDGDDELNAAILQLSEPA